jgi:hypothetical protein
MSPHFELIAKFRLASHKIKSASGPPLLLGLLCAFPLGVELSQPLPGVTEVA